MDGSAAGFSAESIRDYIVNIGGRVTNHQLVGHFKEALTNTDPLLQDAARVKFKEIVKTIATIARDDEGEKYLVVKKKYRRESDSSGRQGWDSPRTGPREAGYDTPTSTRSSSEASPGPRSGTRDAGSEPSLGPRSASRDTGSESPLGPMSGSRDTGSEASLGPRSGSRDTGSEPSPGPRRLSRDTGSEVCGARPASRTSLNSCRSTGSLLDSVATASDWTGSRRPSLASSVWSSFSSSVEGSERSTAQPASLTSRDSLMSQESLYLSPTSTPSTVPPESPPPVPPRRKSHDKIKLSDNKENETHYKRPKPYPLELSEGLQTEEAKISVRERMQRFNRLANETASAAEPLRPKKRFDKPGTEKDEDDCASVNSLQLDPKFREWLVKCSQGDYQAIAKMAAENPRLIKTKNSFNGYTVLHWGAKHGNQDIIKLAAGTYGANVNARTNGGYTALHIAMQYGHEDLYNLLVNVYGAEQSVRDWSGKKARQYQANKDTSVSVEKLSRKLKARKKHSDKEHGFLRIGSLNVRVKRTTEAFSNFLGVGHNDKIHKNWGSADNIPQDEDNKKMPPPKLAPIKKRKSKRPLDFGLIRGQSTGSIETPRPIDHDSDSDTAAGFGSGWH